MKNEIIFQGLTQKSNLEYLKRVIELPNADLVLLSSAFMNKGGLGLVYDELANCSCTKQVYAGVRNGITSAQGVNAALAAGCEVFTIDTGASDIIFHPKVYLSMSDQEVRMLLGSANLTQSGLWRSIVPPPSIFVCFHPLENSTFASKPNSLVLYLFMIIPVRHSCQLMARLG